VRRWKRSWVRRPVIRLPFSKGRDRRLTIHLTHLFSYSAYLPPITPLDCLL